MKVTPY